MQFARLPSTSVYLAASCLLTVFSISTALVGTILGQVLTSALGIFVTFVDFAMLHIVFHIGCGIYENGREILNCWKLMAGRRVYGGYMRRVVKSLQQLSIPAGTVGIFNRATKMNYLNGVMNFTNSGFTSLRKTSHLNLKEILTLTCHSY